MSTKPKSGEGDAVSKGAVIAAVARGVSPLKEALLGQHLWARGYFCATVGAVTEEQIKAYIEAHDEEPAEENFKISG